MAAAGAAAHHDHACSLRDASRAGYDRVVISLRDPAARLVSGFQRRVAGGAKKRANRDLADIFGDDVDGYVEALRDVTHAKHAAALRVSLAPNAQHWPCPSRSTTCAASSRGQRVARGRLRLHRGVDAGVRAVAARWDLRARPPPRRRRTTPRRTNRMAACSRRSTPSTCEHLRARRGVARAHCKNDASFVRYGPSPAPRKGRGASGVLERRAYGRLTVDHARRRRPPRCARARWRARADKRREGVLLLPRDR